MIRQVDESLKYSRFSRALYNYKLSLSISGDTYTHKKSFNCIACILYTLGGGDWCIAVGLHCCKVANFWVVARDVPVLQLVSRLQKTDTLEKMAALEGRIYGITSY